MLHQSEIPEILQPEDQIGQWRLQLLAEISDLGPPDLVQLRKRENKDSPLFTYLYHTGADVRDVSSVAATCFEIASCISNSPQLWFGRSHHFKVEQVTYTTYNAFSQVDLIVTVSIPGGVSWSLADRFGNIIDDFSNTEPKELELIWMETFVSACVRALITADDEGEFAPIVECRRINPFEDSACIDSFLNGFELLFPLGEKLGSSDEYQVSTILHNNLVDALILCVKLTNCTEKALVVLNNLYNEYPIVSYLIAKVMLLGDHEIEAVKFIHEELERDPLNADLLLLQSEYCLSKSRVDLALPLAIKAVNCSPSLFHPWANLVNIYILQNEYAKALFTLNSCPMVTHKDKYILKRISTISSPMPPTSNIHLPLPTKLVVDGVTNLDPKIISIEQSKLLWNLPAANLKSTYKLAYQLLTNLIRKMDWDEVLQLRSNVFVMEEELKNDLKGKRLCERWLDNLFMLLYEDLKLFTQYKQSLPYESTMSDNVNSSQSLSSMASPSSKTAIEWETLGLVSQRLGHVKDAKRCFESALSQRWCVRSSRGLVKILKNYRFTAKRNGKEFTKFDSILLDLTGKLFAWEWKWYKEFSILISDTVAILAKDKGAERVKSEMEELTFAIDTLVKWGVLEV